MTKEAIPGKGEGYDEFAECPIKAGLDTAAVNAERLGSEGLKNHQELQIVLSLRRSILQGLREKVQCPGPQLVEGRILCPLGFIYTEAYNNVAAVYKQENYGLNLEASDTNAPSDKKQPGDGSYL